MNTDPGSPRRHIARTRGASQMDMDRDQIGNAIARTIRARALDLQSMSQVSEPYRSRPHHLSVGGPSHSATSILRERCGWSFPR